MALIDKLTNIGDAIREKTGGQSSLTLDQMAAAIAGIHSGGVKATEYVVTEDADRSLWFNEQGIKLVKGLNFLVAGGSIGKGSIANNRSGLIVHCLILWDGTPVPERSENTLSANSNVIGWHSVSNAYSAVMGASNQGLVSGNTSKLTVGEDGLLSFTTSATGVTTGVYVNSFFGAGNTYYLLQAESEVVC